MLLFVWTFPLALLAMAGSAGAAPPAMGSEITIVALGDSLTAGYGLAPGKSFPAQLETALRAAGHAVRVVNAGVSGDTTAGGATRLEWALANNPAIVIVELGANDALRGLAPDKAEANLDRILRVVKKQGARPILTGMRAPRNLGADYARQFDEMYQRVAKLREVPLYPFFLEGVAGDPALNLPDGLHPNEKGVEEIVRRILPLVQETIQGLLFKNKPS